MRLLLDAQISPGRLAEPLRRRGHDVLALSAEPRLRDIPDEEVLAIAAAQGRIVVTFDADDFPLLLKEYAEADRAHAGCIVVVSCRNDDYGALLRRLDRLFKHPAQENWVSRSRYL